MADEADLEVSLPRARSAPELARRAVRRWGAERVEADVLEKAELLVSELATNAISHGRGEIALRASLDEDRLLVEVIDGGTGFERRLRRDAAGEAGGWGLGMVEDLSSRWGVHEGTTHVWFEIERSGPRLGEPDD